MSQSAHRATVQVGTRSRLIRGSMSDGHVQCTVSDRRCAPARPASHVWNASFGVSAERAQPSADRCPPHQITGFQGLSMNWRFTGCIFRGRATPDATDTIRALTGCYYRTSRRGSRGSASLQIRKLIRSKGSPEPLIAASPRHLWSLSGKRLARLSFMLTRPALPILKNGAAPAKAGAFAYGLENRRRASL